MYLSCRPVFVIFDDRSSLRFQYYIVYCTVVQQDAQLTRPTITYDYLIKHHDWGYNESVLHAMKETGGACDGQEAFWRNLRD